MCVASRLAALVLVSLAASASGAQGRPLVITNANLIDGVRGAFATNATVVIRDGRIAEVVTGAFNPPGDAQVIDARGRYLLPGLIDAHTHIASLASARRALESGVTTVRSASVSSYQDVALREAARSGAITGPDVVATGVFVTPELGESMLADTRLTRLSGGGDDRGCAEGTRAREPGPWGELHQDSRHGARRTA